MSLVVKNNNCLYRNHPQSVIIYYDILSDIFGIVDSRSNKLLEFSVATELDYTDIFRYKSVFQDRTARDLIECPSETSNPFETKCSSDQYQYE